MMLSKMPSDRLKGLLAQLKQDFASTAALVMACYVEALAEGYNAKEARELIIQNTGLNDRTVRRYLPATAKDMRYNRVKQSTADTCPQISESGPISTNDYRLRIEKCWHEEIAKCTAMGQIFNIVIREGKIITIEALIEAAA